MSELPICPRSNGHSRESSRQLADALEVAELQSAWPRDVLRVVKAGGPFHQPSAEYFALAFPPIGAEPLQHLTASVEMLVSSMLCAVDAGVDDSPPSSEVAALQAMALQFEAYRMMQRLFPPNARYWTRLREYLGAFAGACVRRRRFAAGETSWAEFTEQTALEIVRGKFAPTFAVVAGLAELTSEEGAVSQLVQSISGYYTGIQYLADLRTWKSDIRRCLPTLVTRRLAADRADAERARSSNEALASFSRELYYGGHASDALYAADAQLENAARAVQVLPLTEWNNHLRDCRRRVRAAMEDIQAITRRNLSRAREAAVAVPALPPPRGEWQSIAWDALHFVLEEWRKGFGELRHFGYLPRSVGFSGEQEFRVGDALFPHTLQRAYT